MKHPPIVDRARRLRQNAKRGGGSSLATPPPQPTQRLGLPAPSAGRQVRRRFSLPQAQPVVEVDGPTHDDREQWLFDAARTAELERLGFLVVRVKERVVRDATEHVIDWISTVGKLIAQKQNVPQAIRTLDKVPSPNPSPVQARGEGCVQPTKLGMNPTPIAACTVSAPSTSEASTKIKNRTTIMFTVACTSECTMRMTT